jgi:hypothetical protein
VINRVTASKIDLAVECLHWTSIRLPADRPGPAAQFGSAFHSLVEQGPSADLVLPDAETERLVRVMFDGWKKHGLPLLPNTRRHEVAYELLPDGKVRKLGEHIERDYGLITGIAGTIDVVGEDELGERIVDIKTGRKYVAAADAWQLRFASVVTGIGRAEFHYVDKATGKVDVDSATRSKAQIESDRARLVLLMSDLQAKRTPAVPGSHCDAHYCRARPKCDAYRSHMQNSKEKPMGKMSLKNVKKGRLETPLCVVLYGPEGIGKSTFAANAPAPIFLGSEDGTSELDVARFPMPDSWGACMEALDELASAEHDYRTIVIDTADWIEPLIHDHVCQEGSNNSIEDFGYGKGYVLALEEWRKLLGKLDALRMQRGMHVVILAHSQVKAFRNPVGDDYDRYELKLHGKAAALIKEWPKAVLFANYKTYTREKDGRVRGIGDGSRVVYTEHRPAWDAKNRYDLPYEMPLNWEDFERAARAGWANSEQLLLEIEKLLSEAKPDIQGRARSAIERASGDHRKLSQLADWIRTKISESEAA